LSYCYQAKLKFLVIKTVLTTFRCLEFEYLRSNSWLFGTYFSNYFMIGLFISKILNHRDASPYWDLNWVQMGPVKLKSNKSDYSYKNSYLKIAITEHDNFGTKNLRYKRLGTTDLHYLAFPEKFEQGTHFFRLTFFQRQQWTSPALARNSRTGRWARAPAFRGSAPSRA
jgi:hypothetical protein